MGFLGGSGGVAAAVALTTACTYIGGGPAGILRHFSADPLTPTSATGASKPRGSVFSFDKGDTHCPDRQMVHTCFEEVRQVVDVNSTVARAQAEVCIRDTLNDLATGMWELRNMTHLLLDLDTSEHYFDREGRDSTFVRMGLDFAERLVFHDECARDFDDLEEFECRCPLLYGKLAILKLKNAGRVAEAQQLFARVKEMSYVRKDGSLLAPGKAVQWDNFLHTPQIWIPGIRSQPVWPRALWSSVPIADVLEKIFPIVLEETQQVLKTSDNAGTFDVAYRFLFEKGDWSQVLLYHGREWTDKCALMPRTCDALQQHLPFRPEVPWTSSQNQQVLILRMKPGTSVETHCGPSNGVLNVHLGLSGTEKAKLFIAGEEHGWEAGKVIVWDGSYDHSVHCLECVEDRLVMMVRYLHPDVSTDHFVGHTKTQFDAVNPFDGTAKLK